MESISKFLAADFNGYGRGNGDGRGNGNGDGRGIAEINGHPVYEIDEVPTIIESVMGNIARGYALRRNVQLEPCYVAKVHGYYAHGKTAHEAYADALAKWEQNKPLEERIGDVIAEYPTLDSVVPNSKLYDIHGKLTGSCRFGRDEFAKAHGIDVENGSMTMREFIKLTETAYGGEEIKELEKAYKI